MTDICSALLVSSSISAVKTLIMIKLQGEKLFHVNYPARPTEENTLGDKKLSASFYSFVIFDQRSSQSVCSYFEVCGRLYKY